MEALNEWAESKKYVDHDKSALVGFFGPTTLEQYAARPKIEGLNLGKRWKARKEAKRTEQGKARRGTVA